MNPTLAQLMIMKWEEEKMDKEGKIRKFMTYVDNSIGIWKEEELKEKVVC